MTARELIKFMLVPAFIAAVLAENLGYVYRAFSGGEAIAITAMIASFFGYLAYLNETRRRARLAEAKARAIEEYERHKADMMLQTQADENLYQWERHFSEIMSWRDQITGCGVTKEVSPWE